PRAGRSFIWFLLFLLIAQPVNARPLTAPPLPGKWVGQWQRTLNTTNCTSDPCVTSEAIYTMPMMIRVNGDNTITEGELTFQVSVVAAAGALGVAATCSGEGQFIITGGTVSAGSGGAPVFEMTVQPTGNFPIYCNGMLTDDGPGIDFQLTLAGTGLSGNTVTGEKAGFIPDKFDWGVAQMQSAGASVTVSEAWDLTNTAPFLNNLAVQYERYFLETVALNNRYRATVDWNGNAPGHVTFAGAGQSVDVAASGETVDFNLDLGSVPAGQHTVEATAYTAEGDPSIARETDLIIVPLPGWGRNANFAVDSRAGSTVIYKGHTHAPEQPLKLPYLDIPDIIPLVNGRWGIPPLQVPVDLLATSAGGQSAPAPMKTTVELYLGGDVPEVDLDFEGETITSMGPTALTLAKSEVETTVPIFNKEVQVGLLDLVPQMAAITRAPIVGDLVEALNGIASLTGQLNVNVDGTVTIGPNTANSALTFTSGSLTPRVQAHVQFMLNFFNLASAWVGGGGAGQFTLQVAPEPRWQGCNLSLNFSAGARVAGLFHEQYTREWPVTTCGGAAELGSSKGFATTLSAPTFSLIARPADWQPERAVLNTQTRNGVEQTTLVENAAADAAPALAVGPENRLAFVWISEDPDLARPRSQEISLRLYDGAAWGDPIRLTDNMTFDAAPAVAFDRAGRVVVAWVEHKERKLTADVVFDTDFAQVLEIFFAVIDPAKGKILRQAPLTSDNVMDFNPQLARGQDGALWLGWINSPGATLTGNAAEPNRVMAAQWDGARWTEPEAALDGLVGTLTWRLAARDTEQALIVADVDRDGKLSTAADREIVVAERTDDGWASARDVTADAVLDMAPLAAYTPAGEPLLAWASEGTVFGLSGDLAAAPQSWLTLDDATPLLNGVLLTGAGGERLLLWPEQTAALDVNVSRYDPARGTWSAPEAFLSQTRQATSLTAGITAQGDLVVGLASLDPVTEAVTLETGETFAMPGQAQAASLLVAGVTSSFTPPPALVTEEVRLAPQGGGVLLWVGGGVVLLALAGGAVWWFKKVKAGA
ncbi:MAG: hypothetical protein JXA21_01485, partial [Anaerolineae bacterium]|nr:hypothetical protein [Anaerolineae bacterium]